MPTRVGQVPVRLVKWNGFIEAVVFWPTHLLLVSGPGMTSEDVDRYPCQPMQGVVQFTTERRELSPERKRGNGRLPDNAPRLEFD